MNSKVLLFCLTLFALEAWGKSDIRLFSFGLGYSSISAFGSNYVARSTSTALLTGSLTWGLSERWALRVMGDLSPDGQTAYLGAGVNFYSTPPYMSSFSPSEDAKVTQIPNWSHFVGATFGINRVQIALERTSGSQSDVVLGALLGPTIHAGSLQSWGHQFFITYEAFYRYSQAPPIGASEFGILICPTFQLP